MPERAKAWFALIPAKRPESEWKHVHVTKGGARTVDVKELLNTESVRQDIKELRNIELDSRDAH